MHHGIYYKIYTIVYNTYNSMILYLGVLYMVYLYLCILYYTNNYSCTKISYIIYAMVCGWDISASKKKNGL